MKKHTTIICKRIISLVLVFVLTVSLLPSATLSVSAAENFTDFLGGDGSEKLPYLIANKTHLNNVRKYATANAHFKLLQDIEFNEKDKWNEISEFNGVLDGDNHSIIKFGVYIDYDEYNITNSLFKKMSGTIRNLNISGRVNAGGFICENNYGYLRNCKTDGSVICRDTEYTGGLAAKNYGTIINCINNAGINSQYYGVGGITGMNYGNIKYCENYGSVHQYWYEYGTGGIASVNNGKIIGCVNKAKSISTDYGYAGGIAGENNRYILLCHNAGYVYGGLESNHAHAAFVGRNNSQGYISDCYNTGDAGAYHSTEGMGIFFAYNYGVIVNSYSAVVPKNTKLVDNIFGYRNSGKIMSCYYLIPWENFTGKGICYGDNTAIGCIAEEMINKSTFRGFDFDRTWKIDSESDYPYPVLTGTEVLDVQIAYKPDKTYSDFVGSDPDISDVKLKVKYSDGSENIINADVSMCRDFDNKSISFQNVKLTYQGKETIETIRFKMIELQIASIEVYKKPTKINYVQGQKVDFTGGEILVKYNNGTESIIDMTSVTAIYDKNLTGTVPITFSYEGFNTSMNISVKEKQVDYMTFNPPEKLVYFQGESLDLTNVSLDVHYVSDDNYSEKVKVTNEMISGYDPNKYGIQNVTVTYLGESATFIVRVIGKMVSISVKNMPDKLVYIKGAPLDLTGGLLNVNYSDGFTTTINMNDAKPYYNRNLLGDVTVRLEYEGFNTFFQIVVNEKQITSIAVEKEPDKLEYVQGQPLDLNGGIIKIFYNDDTIETVEMKEAKPYYNRNLTGDITVRLNYKDIDTYLQIKVNKKAVAKMSFSIPEKTEYKVGEELDLSGLSLDVIYKSKDNYGEIITVTPDMVSGYDSKKVGIQSIIVKYLNVKVEFEVEVVPIIGDIDGNCVVDIKDATMLQRYFAEISTISAQSIAVADVNNDGDVTISDVTAIQLYLITNKSV